MPRINALGHLGLCAAGAGRLREAHERGTAAMTLADARGWNTLEQVSTTYLTLALVGMHRNDPMEAERVLQLGLAAQPTRADRLPLTGMLVTRVRVLTARHRLTPAGCCVATRRSPGMPKVRRADCIFPRKKRPPC